MVGLGEEAHTLRNITIAQLTHIHIHILPHPHPAPKPEIEQETNKRPAGRNMDEDDERPYDEEDDDEEDGERLPPKVEELAQASVPTTLKGVRACLCCGIIKTLDQFLEYG